MTKEMLIICTIIFIIVFPYGIYNLITGYRKAKEQEKRKKQSFNIPNNERAIQEYALIKGIDLNNFERIYEKDGTITFKYKKTRKEQNK